MSAVKNQIPQDQLSANDQRYVEVAPLRLSERDSIAFINSIRFPPEPNDFLKETMRKHRKRS